MEGGGEVKSENLRSKSRIIQHSDGTAERRNFFCTTAARPAGTGEAEGVGRDDVQTAVLAEHEVSQRRSCHSSRKPCWNYPTGQE